MVKPHLSRAALLLLPAVAAACGTGTAVMQGAPPPSPRAQVLASMKQVQATSYRFTMRLAMTGFGSAMGSAASAFAFSEAGAYSAGQRALDATLTSPLLKAAKLGSGIREIVFLGTRTVYVSIASGAGGPKWYEVTGTAAGAASFGALLGSLDDDSPLGYIGNVNGAVAGARRVGPATVDGVATTEYAVTENLRTVLDKLLANGFAGAIAKSIGGGSAAGGVSSKALTAALKALPPDLTIQAYLDSAGHLRRMSLTIPVGPMFTAAFAGLAGVPSAELSMLKDVYEGVQEHVTMDLTDFGAAIHVTAPPASQVSAGLPPGVSGSASSGSGSSASGSASAVTGATGVTGVTGLAGVTGAISDVTGTITIP